MEDLNSLDNLESYSGTKDDGFFLESFCDGLMEIGDDKINHLFHRFSFDSTYSSGFQGSDQNSISDSSSLTIDSCGFDDAEFCEDTEFYDGDGDDDDCATTISGASYSETESFLTTATANTSIISDNHHYAALTDPIELGPYDLDRFIVPDWAKEFVYPQEPQQHQFQVKRTLWKNESLHLKTVSTVSGLITSQSTNLPSSPQITNQAPFKQGRPKKPRLDSSYKDGSQKSRPASVLFLSHKSVAPSSNSIPTRKVLNEKGLGKFDWESFQSGSFKPVFLSTYQHPKSINRKSNKKHTSKATQDSISSSVSSYYDSKISYQPFNLESKRIENSTLKFKKRICKRIVGPLRKFLNLISKTKLRGRLNSLLFKNQVERSKN
ncbi:expressed protein [Phakopsora pachyrhizi]|uniref:Expressed protein n=1 Tax=Phakopsora pachyrhizi TaxID=170000 RepID=A0AAV0AG44_PHAPC|nr:expressed protein [Phakopsora pachyrhizi]